jgi:hypothetical protein
VINNKSAGYVNHHNKETDNNGVKGKNVSESLETLFKAIIMRVKIPGPNCTHNDGH